MDEMSPEVAARIRGHVEALAALDYPRVWVGEPGISVEEALAIQEINDELPEYLRVEPGDEVEIEGSGEMGVQVPGMSVDWIDGLWALTYIPDLLLDEGVFADLEEHVMEVWAAKEGMVRVFRCWTLMFEPMGALGPEDIYVAKAVTEDGSVMVPGVPEYDLVPVEALAPEDVDEELLEVQPYYVIGDTPRARTAVETRLSRG